MLALKVGTIVFGIIGVLGLMVAAVGSIAAPLAFVDSVLYASGCATVYGISTGSLGTISSAAIIGGKITGYTSLFGITVSNAVNRLLNIQNYKLILAGQSFRKKKMGLTEWQQCECKRTLSVDSRTVGIETVMMRPIFSGSKINGNRNHHIQWWIDRYGTTRDNIKGSDEVRPHARSSTQQLLIFANGTVQNAYTGAIVDVSSL